MVRYVAAAVAVVLALSALGFFAMRFLGQAPQLEDFVADPWTSHDTVHSSVLGRDIGVQVFLPAGEPDGVPVLFLFHGRGGDETQWMAGHVGDGVGIDRLAHRLIDEGAISPVAIVSAAIDDSYGVDSEAAADGYSHGPYETYIVDELVPEIESRYRVGGTPANRAIGGLSMGGFAALNVALGHPGMFDSIGALSPAFFVDPPRDRLWIYGVERERDPVRLVDSVSMTDLNLFVGFGDRDYGWIQEATRSLAAHLTMRGYAVEPVVVAGGHDVGTWRQLAEPMLQSLFSASP